MRGVAVFVAGERKSCCFTQAPLAGSSIFAWKKQARDRSNRRRQCCRRYIQASADQRDAKASFDSWWR